MAMLKYQDDPDAKPPVRAAVNGKTPRVKSKSLTGAFASHMCRRHSCWIPACMCSREQSHSRQLSSRAVWFYNLELPPLYLLSHTRPM